ncbi:MAG: TIGR01906 family membrane protein [Sporolactobacillus sp.]
MIINRYQIMQLLLAACIAAAVTCFAVLFTIAFTPLYAFDSALLGIAKQNALSQAQIMANYRYMVHFLLNPLPQTFQLPSLPSSVHGRLHFQDVKHLITGFETVLLVSGLASAWAIRRGKCQNDHSYLRLSALLLTCMTSVTLVALLIDFNDIFITFHKLVFSNNYWIFDPTRDPVINILPETFFMHAALLILVLIVTAIIALELIDRRVTRGKSA